MENIDLSEGQETFNNLLTSTITSAKPVLPRNKIVETYIENDGVPLNTIELNQTTGTAGLSGTEEHGYNASLGGFTNEDPWSKTSKTISDLYERQSQLSQLRKSVTGPDLDFEPPEHTEATLAKKSFKETQAIEASLANRDKFFAHDTPLAAELRYDQEPVTVHPGETTITVNNDTIINRYHTLKQKEPVIQLSTLEFAAKKINPPRCLLDVLDAFFELIFGVFERQDANYPTLVSYFYLYSFEILI